MELLKTLINPKEEGINIEDVTYTTNRNIRIKTTNNEDIRKLKNKAILKREGFQFTDPTPRKPTIMIYNVDEHHNKTDLMREIHENNTSMEDLTTVQFGEQFVPLFPIANQKQGNTKHWVVEVTPAMRKRILENNWRIKTTWARHRVEDYLDATRCFRCQLYGHPARYCIQEHSTCGHCGEQKHRFSECPNRNSPPICTPCKRSGKPSDHPVTSKTSPSRIRAIKEKIKNTEYDTEEHENSTG